MKTAAISAFLALLMASDLRADGWKNDKIWYDGLVEKAVYSASRVIYGKPRSYQAIFLTNKETHDLKTMTKASTSNDTIEVWKHNQIEDIPTPNYTYHYVTTTHLTTADFYLTRLDCGEMEWCGTSFKQYLSLGIGKGLSYQAWSYMPQAGKMVGLVSTSDRARVAWNSLPLWLRDYDFKKGETIKIFLLPDQRSNQQTEFGAQDGEIRFRGEEDGSYKLEVSMNGKLAGTYWMAKDRLHIMTRYESADGTQKYELKSQDRVNYWTIQNDK